MDTTNKLDNQAKTPRWKTLILLCLAVYPTINLVGLLFSPLVSGWPIWLATLLTLPITMVIVSYAILPLLTRLLARWLNS
ncbi:MAG: hypothetical protein NT075_15975 [Chloroflexi bacterium]|nr:hypothetical protein [Chloroflexota bacterium]